MDIERFFEACYRIVEVFVFERYGDWIHDVLKEMETDPVAGADRDDLVDEDLGGAKKRLEDVFQEVFILKHLVFHIVFVVLDERREPETITYVGEVGSGDEIDLETGNDLDAVCVVQLRKPLIDVPDDAFVKGGVSQDLEPLVVDIADRRMSECLSIQFHPLVVCHEVDVFLF
jgi:hypothetical protein